MSFSETIFLFFLALVIFGPKKLPEIARQVGKALNDFKRASNEFKAQIEQEIAHLEVEKPQILPPSLTSSSWAGDRHTTEGLAPEGTASRSLTSANVISADNFSENAQPPSGQSAATLAAPGLEDSDGRGNPPDPSSVAAEALPATGSATARSAQESHA